MEWLGYILSAVLCVISSSYLLQLISSRLKYIKRLNKIPGPKTYPIVGNLPDILVPTNKLMLLSTKLWKENGQIFRIWNAHLGVVQISRAEYLEKVLSSTKEIQKSNVYRFLHPWLGTGLLTSKGQKWFTHRKMITPTFHFKILETFVEVFAEKSAILIEKLKKIPEGTVVDLYPYITHCALDIICESAMGTNIHAQSDNNSGYVSAVYDMSKLTIKRQFRPWLRTDLIFYLTEDGKRYNRAIKTLHSFTNKVIAERKASRQLEKSSGKDRNEDESLGIKKRQAFLDLLLEASEVGSKLTDVDLREEVDTFMFEGHDTTTAGISWSLYLLGSHPECQEKVMEELDNIFQGSDRAATINDLNEMKYLERVIKEALRLYPSVPFIGRQLENDFEIGKYVVPAGTQISLNLFHMHRDPEQFPDPEKFNPDNFLPEVTKNRHPYAYTPFSAGPRNCIGQKFAILEEKMVISTVLRNYRVESTQKKEDIVLLAELILRPEKGLLVKLFPRNPNTS